MKINLKLKIIIIVCITIGISISSIGSVKANQHYTDSNEEVSNSKKINFEDWLIELIVAIIGALLSTYLAATKRGRKAVKDTYNKSKEFLNKTFEREEQHPPKIPILSCITGDFAGVILEMDEKSLAIGRDPRVCQLIFPKTAKNLSKRHCILYYNSSKCIFFIEDAWSTNGTFLISGEMLKPGKLYCLQAGEHFYLGDMNNLFKVNLEEKQNE